MAAQTNVLSEISKKLAGGWAGGVSAPLGQPFPPLCTARDIWRPVGGQPWAWTVGTNPRDLEGWFVVCLCGSLCHGSHWLQLPPGANGFLKGFLEQQFASAATWELGLVDQRVN